MINQKAKQDHSQTEQSASQNNQQIQSASLNPESDQLSNAQTIYAQINTRQINFPQANQSNLMLINNQKIQGQATPTENSSLYLQENPMMRGSLNPQDNKNIPVTNFMQGNQAFPQDLISQQISANNIYPSNNSVGAYLNNINNTNYHTAAMYSHPMINQSGNPVYPGFPNSEGNYGIGMSNMSGFMNAHHQHASQQLHPSQQQQQLQQTSIISQIAPEQQGSNLYAGYIAQMHNNQPGVTFNYDMASMSKQHQAHPMLQQYQMQPKAFQQYQNFMMQSNFLQSQNTFQPMSISNIFPEQQNSGMNAMACASSQSINPTFYQTHSQGNLTTQSNNEQDQMVIFRKQSNNLNQLNLSSHQISQKTANSQKSSASKEALLENQENSDNQKGESKEKSSQPQESKLSRKVASSFSAVQTTTSGKDAFKNSINLTNFDNDSLFSQMKNKANLQQNKSMPFIIKKQEEEDQQIEFQKIKDNKIQFSKQQIIKKISFDQSSNSSAPQQILQSNNLRAFQTSLNESKAQNISIEGEQYEQEFQNVGQSNMRRKSMSQSMKNMKDNISQQTHSSSPPSKKYTNQLTSKYRHVSEDKSNFTNTCNSQNDNQLLDQQSSLVEVYVDNRKRSTSIDHSNYLQLSTLLTDKRVIDEFTQLILFKGIEGITPNLNQQISDYNSTLFRAGNYELIKKYKQLLNQTFYELKHSNQQSSFTPFISSSYSSEEENILKVEDTEDNQEFKQTNLSSFNYKSQKAHSIVDSIQRAILTKIPLLFKEDYILDSLKLIPSGQYQVYSNLQNMCIQFVRGEKRKRFKERNKDSQYMSRFHNLNRLFFYQIMSMYSYESLSCFQIDPTISEQLRIIISFIKIHSKLQLINPKSKSTSINSNPQSKQNSEQSQKTDKRKRSHSVKDDGFSSTCSATLKQIKKDSYEGIIAPTNSQDNQRISSKKSQKINEKLSIRLSNQSQDQSGDSVQQGTSSIYNMTTRSLQKKSSVGHESQTQSISINDNFSRQRASTFGESTKATSEKNIIHQREEISSAMKSYVKDSQAFQTINEGDNNEHISQTPSPMIKDINIDNQETQKKQMASNQADFFTLNNDQECSLANQITAKKYSSTHQDTNDSADIQVEIEDNTYQTPSNHQDIKNISSSKKTDTFIKNKPVKKVKKVAENESSNDEKNDLEESSKDGATDNIQGDCFGEDDEDDDDENIDFPIKNYKKYYRILKVENYTHSHYNTLFLKLNASSIEHLKKQQKDVDSHWLAYKIDLRNPELIPPEKIQFVNIMKSLFYKIFMHFNNFSFQNRQAEQQKILEAIINDPIQPLQKDSQEFKQIELRLDYYLRVVQGIQKLNQGYYSHKF